MNGKEGTIDFSIAETMIIAMGLRLLAQTAISPRDKEIAEDLIRRLTVKHRGQEIKLILFTK